jgi:undecaprenyl phosphate N,N'-diacetylbacillosamine 1-phosphate transferase
MGMNIYRHFIKRFFDILLSLFLLLILSPILIILIILLSTVNNWKPFYIQRRPGKNGIAFNLVKFKTMRDINVNDIEIIHDSQRVTLIGKFLRSFSLDELPQLFNVIVGDMSLIGPRPLLMEYLPLYDEFQSRRNEIKPGITGWAQVNGRKGITFSRRFELDIWYVDHISFWLDFKIFWLTIIKIISRDRNPPGKLAIDVDDVGFRKRLGIKESYVS